MTTVFNSLAKWRKFRQQSFFTDKTVGVVTTMGNLHQGHKSLLQRSVQENAITILTLFVNPTQFDNPDDLTHYPRTFTQDLAMAREVGVDFIIAPEAKEIYADNYTYKVSESTLSQQFCGKYRPGHFDGVLTVVLKLLLLAKADRAYFGEKDYQQLQLVQGMTQAFFIDTQIIACPTLRDNDGVALSSRNSRLSKEQRQLAQHFLRLLSSEESNENIRQALIEFGFSVDYIEEYQGRRLGAVRLGAVRLIDNILR